MPRGPIVVDKQQELIDVVGRLRNVLGVSLTLIPDDTPNAIGMERINHPVEYISRILMSPIARCSELGFRLSLALLEAFELVLCRCRIIGRGFRVHLLDDCAGPGVVHLNPFWHPTFNRRSDIRLQHDANWDSEFLMQFSAELKGDGGACSRGVRCARSPLDYTIFLWFMTVASFRTEYAKTRVIGGGAGCQGYKAPQQQ